MSVAHAREMVAACRDRRRDAAHRPPDPSDAAVVRAREIGRLPARAAAEISLERGSAYPARKTWRRTKRAGNFDVGVHLLDLIQWVSGQRFVEVSAFSQPDRKLGKSDDTVTVLGRLEGECHALARATREVGSAENNLIIEGAEATLFTSPLRFAKEHVVSVRDKNGVTEERFPASPAYALEVSAFEANCAASAAICRMRNSLQTVAATQAVCSRRRARIVTVPATPDPRSFTESAEHVGDQLFAIASVPGVRF